MDVNKKSGNLTKRHFAKFHERIQNKYEQMQKRIKKSKSMESVSSFSEELVTEKRTLSTVLNKEDKNNEVKEESLQVKSETNFVTYSVIVEDVNKQEVLYQDCEEVLQSESDVTPSIQHDDDEVFFDDDEFSFDELFEVTTAAPSQKVSLRDKLAAIRERRKEERKRKKDIKIQQSDGSERHDQFILSNKPLEASKKKNRAATVIIALIEATLPQTEAPLDQKPRQFYCRIRLGHEKYKTKTVKIKDNLAPWRELFNLNLFEDTCLEISMWEKDKDPVFGRATVDLSELKQDTTNHMNLSLEDGEVPVKIQLLITVTGTVQVQPVQDIDPFDDYERKREIKKMEKKFSWMVLQDDFESTGWLSVVVFEARGLPVHDSLAVLVLGNDRVQTQTVLKQSDPYWGKTFHFNVRDSTSILYISVYDEKKLNIMGKLAIPLLTIVNDERKWYALKDESLKERAKGHNPRILLEMCFYYNEIKSALRIINPKEKILIEVEPPFSRQVFGHNISRAKAVVDWITETVTILKSLFEWETMEYNVAALIGWLIFWWNFEAYMLPLLLLIPFYWYRPLKYQWMKCNLPIRWRRVRLSSMTLHETRSNISRTSSRPDSIRQRLQSVQDMVQTVQNGIGTFAGLGESVKNLFNFSVPFLSIYAIILIVIISIILYFIDFRYLLMVWGIHKILRKTLRPDRVPNNEILDLLSRVPNDETVDHCRELPVLDQDSSSMQGMSVIGL